MKTQFWMVLSSNAGSSCSRIHLSAKEAKAEAERLTLKEQHPFFILEAVDICRPAPRVLWESLEKETTFERNP